jgi:hypothetical protein
MSGADPNLDLGVMMRALGVMMVAFRNAECGGTWGAGGQSIKNTAAARAVVHEPSLCPLAD